jgi:N-acetylglucosamine-6-phosphate deacetylase
MVALAKRNLDDALYLISDAATPCDVGVYQHMERSDRYVTVDPLSKIEVLSGSKLTMLKAIANCVQFVGIDLPEAVNMATLYPARVLGIENSFGSLHAGRKANFVIFNESFKIINVIYKGEFVKQ